MLSADPVGQLLFSAGQALTPSQFATAPFAAPALHSAHLAIHDRETKLSALAKLLTLGPSYFETCKYCVRPIGVLPTARRVAYSAPHDCPAPIIVSGALNVSVDISTATGPDTILELILNDMPPNATTGELTSALTATLGAPAGGLGERERVVLSDS